MSSVAPRVAVIVPAYNFDRYVGDALESVLAQTFASWECVVVDDGSTDGTAAVAERYAAADPRIRCIRQPNRGVSAARNLALQSTTAELVQFLDADDRLVPEKLEKHVRYLDEHPETSIVYGNVVYFRSDAPDTALFSPFGKLSRSALGDRVHGAEEALRKLEHFNFLHPTSALSRRTAIETAGGFCESVHGAEDYDLWLKCAIAGFRFDHWEESTPVAWIRVHPASTSRSRGKILRAIVAAALAFRESPLRVRFRGGERLPLVYELGVGVHEVSTGQRRQGARRIRNAAHEASDALTAMRWRVYALAALLLPHSVFRWLVTMPIPESALELYRRVRGMWSRRRPR
jgi:cellulose synthase/poly-beta-1,6-N-acetylglucosamine synthase-like glycosyltransferase